MLSIIIFMIFMNDLFYETNFALGRMRILAGDRYENNGVEVSC